MTAIQTKHYFDWASTSPIDTSILAEALEETSRAWGNPSSIHSAGKEARNLLEDARKRCAEVLGVSAEKLFFTSGGTESDHIPLLSVLNRPQKGTVLISAIEHPAVREMAAGMQKCGIHVIQIPPDSDGIITPRAVTGCLTPDTLIVCVMAVNNETGAIQPVYDIAAALTEATAGKRRPKFHVDCVQAAGKIPLNLTFPGIDSAAFSAHKICGPRGIGLLYLKDSLEPFLKGGGQEKNVRSGTENVFGAVAFAKCLEKYYLNEKNTDMQKHFTRQQEITHRFLQKITQIPGCTVIPAARMEKPELYSPWVVQAAFRTIPGQVMLRALDAEGFCISTGSACSARKNNRPVLEAMHIPAQVSETAVRFSFGPLTEETAVDELAAKVAEIAGHFHTGLPHDKKNS